MNTVELSPQDIYSFQTFVLRFYNKHGRHELPWRQTNNPYKVLVSELMLQQTQVNRVIPKYLNFIATFPSIDTLSKATLSQVLGLWQGLGYNRRAKFLWQLAQKLSVSNKKQPFPNTLEELQKLPGIGPYTASAIMSFAYNKPTTVIETNIRTVFIHHFFADKIKVSDTQLLELIKQCIPHTNPKEWYWALMDYGSYLKKVLPNPSRKSKHHTKQSTFKGSLRQVRGEIIKILLSQPNLTAQNLKKQITGNKLHFEAALEQLLTEKLVVIKNNTVSLP
jgi:A/G-specific adenine glycosylase